MKKILVTGATDNYYQQIIPYIISIDKNSNFDDNVLVTLDFHVNSFTRVKHFYLDNSLVKNKNPNNCLQHGEFLECDYFKNLKSKDIICFTDGDIILQRELLNEEIFQFESLKDNEVLVQWNNGPGHTLKDEFHNLKPTCEQQTFEKSFNINLEQYSCFNTGVVIANLKTWKKIKRLYSKYQPLMKDAFEHYAKQQWILSYIFCKYLKPIVMDYSIHSHYHLGRLPNTLFIKEQLYCETIHNDKKVLKKVLFNHFCVNEDLNIGKLGFLEQQKRFLSLHVFS